MKGVFKKPKEKRSVSCIKAFVYYINPGCYVVFALGYFIYYSVQ